MPEVRRGVMVLFQAEHPGEAVPDPLHGAIQWRLLFPLLGAVLHLPSPALFGLAHAGCFAVLVFLVALLRRNGLGWLACGACTLALGATSWFFTSMSWLGYYDAWLVLGLLLVAFAESRWVLWCACVWAPWVDERFVLAAPLALLCRFLYRQPRDSAPGRSRDVMVAGGLVVAFAVVRLAVLGGQSAPHATVDGYLARFGGFDAPVSRLLFGAWTGLRVAWVFAALALLFLWRRDRAQAAVLAAATVLLAAVGLGTAQDFSRSMMLVFPVAVLGAVWSREFGARRPAWVAGAAAALLLPAHHVMSDAVRPVYYFYRELAAIGDPPPIARAEVHELRGIQAMQRAAYVEAAEALSLAMKLAPNPASAAKQRGVLFASQKQWAAARNDFALVVQHDPKDPDGWFLRAQAALALGEATAAYADAERARSIAPAGWTERPDVVSFFNRLQRQPGK